MSQPGPAGRPAYIVSVDQGTSGTTAALYDRQVRLVASHTVPVASTFPESGWVEQDPWTVLASVQGAFRQVVEAQGLQPGQLVALGMAHQGESLLLWDRVTGNPVYNIISWRCVRSADLVARLRVQGLEPEFRGRTGLPLDPEWPATKLPWVIEHVPGAADLLEGGRLVYSQIDAWLNHRLTGASLGQTDHAMACRSGLYNINHLAWDAVLLTMFGAERLVLPRIAANAGDFGVADMGGGWRVPWRGNILDQAAALLGQACIQPGDAKVSYGTCAGFWYNVGDRRLASRHMDTSVAWLLDDRPVYAMVGETTTAGSAIAWLREQFGLPWRDDELSDLAQAADGQDELLFVPAFSGLAAPHWSTSARGTIFGLTGGTGPAHLLRAGLEAIAYSVRDIAEAFVHAEGLALPNVINADGGLAANEFLLQFQADILGTSVRVPRNREATLTGAACLAGVAEGYYRAISQMQDVWEPECEYAPRMEPVERERRYRRWRDAVARTIAAYQGDGLV